MANNTIVISRIQNRRGRRENLPQPLLPGEMALTADTSQVWMGQDPDLAVPNIRVYTDKTDGTAQTIVDTNIVEAKYDGTFVAADFTTLQTELLADGTVTLTSDDILYDDTFRGNILTITVDAAGTGYTTGDAVTAISSTGSGFVGTVVDNGGGGIASIAIANGGQNYTAAGTTFQIANGTSGAISVADGDVHGYTVHIAARPNVDPNNTIANIGTALAGTSITSLISSGAFSGTFVGGSRSADNHTEAQNTVALINKVNAATPSETTGLVYTGLNVEVTTPPDDAIFQIAASDLTTALTTGTNNAYFRMPRGMTLTEVRASLLTASTSGAVTVDINLNGVSMLSTLLTIDQDEKTSLTAATPAVISTTSVADDDEITVDIDGAGTGALGLIVTLIGIA